MKRVKFHFEVTGKGIKTKYTLKDWENVAEHKDLPRDYIMEVPFFYEHKYKEESSINIGLEFGTKRILKVGQEFNAIDYTMLISTMKIAGERLAKINARPRNIVVEI